MNTEQITEILHQNNIPYSEDFQWTERNGCIDEYRDIFTSAYEQLRGYVRFGVNNGFSDKMKDAVTNLVKAIVAIGEETDAKKKSKHAKRITDIDIAVKNELSGVDNAGGACNVMVHVKQYITAYLSSLDVLISGEDDTDDCEILSSARNKLCELETVLESVVDVCSAEALRYAESIIGNLKSWGRVIASGLPDAKNNELLDAAVNTAKEWARRAVGVTKGRSLFGSRKSNIATDISSIKFTADGMVTVAQGNAALAKILTFQKTLKKRKAKLAEEFDTSRERAAIEELSVEAAGYTSQMQETVNKYQNGLITATAAEARMEELDSRKQACEKRIARQQHGIDEKMKSLALHQDSLSILENLSEDVERKKHNHQVIEYIVSKIDFEKVNNILTGYASKSDVDHILFIRKVLSTFEDGQVNALGATVKIYDEYIEQRMHEQEEREREERKKTAAHITHEDTEEKAAAKMNKWAQMLGGTPMAPAAPKAEEDELPLIPFPDDIDD